MASHTNSRVDFEHECISFLKDLKEENNFGASFLDTGIKLSLEHLDFELKNMSDISPTYSMKEYYTSFCVLKKQGWMPETVLARMWRLDVKTAERISTLFSSMHLVKIAARKNDGKEQVGLRLHDLHHNSCRKQARGNLAMEKWHFRLLKGHIPSHLGWTITASNLNVALQAVAERRIDEQGIYSA